MNRGNTKTHYSRIKLLETKRNSAERAYKLSKSNRDKEKEKLTELMKKYKTALSSFKRALRNNNNVYSKSMIPAYNKQIKLYEQVKEQEKIYAKSVIAVNNSWLRLHKAISELHVAKEYKRLSNGRVIY